MHGTTLAAALAFATAVGAQVASTPADQQKAQLYYEEGWRDLSSESFEEAVKDFSQASALDPTLKLAFYGLGRAHMSLHHFPEAAAAYEHARDMYASQAANTYVNQAEADRIRQDDQRTLQSAIQQLGNKSTNSANSAQMLALKQDLLRTQMKQQTNRDVTLANMVPAFIEVALGSAYFRASRLVDAEREYKAATQADPKAGEAWNNLAVVYLQTSRFEEAQRAVDNAEKAGFKVHPGLKDDIKKKRTGG